MDATRIVPGLIPLPKTEVPGLGTPPAAGGPSFGDVLKDSLASVNDLQHQADRAITDLATGGPTSLHDTMLALEKADLSFRLMMQVRNKIVEAYQEVVRMQV
ncbi:MAG TPA: flagellar hook-basal body complex protein FliE [Candidatus Binatia bacterium]|jgi:flagellar hook-basal body complex protein FliE|nr:flagellar hook-basal body complex protein FliE [Candidatus Binatia bacterium]